jgi:hypothetical protein
VTIKTHDEWINISLRNNGHRASRKHFQYISVYGPQADGDKALFLEEPEAVRYSCPGAWAVVGNFNLVLDAADKNNARINRRNMALFRRVVDRLQLCDMDLTAVLYLELSKIQWWSLNLFGCVI